MRFRLLMFLLLRDVKSLLFRIITFVILVEMPQFIIRYSNTLVLAIILTTEDSGKVTGSLTKEPIYRSILISHSLVYSLTLPMTLWHTNLSISLIANQL
jgi:hypothetical protein